MNENIPELQKMLHMEEAQKSLRPQVIGSTFIKFITEDGLVTLNIRHITTICPYGEKTKVFLSASGYYVVEHPYEEINNALKLSIIH